MSIVKKQEIGSASGEFAEWGIVPETKHIELRVATTAAQASLTPAGGKKIRIHSFFISATVTAALTSTLRGSLSFGTGGVGTASKVLWSSRRIAANDVSESWSPSLNIVGAVDETVTLTHITFSGGTALLRAIIYYTEE